MTRLFYIIIAIPFLCLASPKYNSATSGSNKIKTIECDSERTTLDISICKSKELELAKDELSKYLKASIDHNSSDPKLVESIKKAQSDWTAYFESHCNAISIQWREGSFGVIMHTECETKLTKKRTYEIWKNFLTYMDNSAVLPEPK